MRRAARIDNNQNEIVIGLRKFGAVVLITSQLKNCFDILVFYKGKTHVMEIKDGASSKLTDGENEFKAKIENVDVKYNIVRSLSDAVNVLV